jgi:hypothetical protein
VALLFVLSLFGAAPRAGADTPPVGSCDNSWVCVTVGTGASPGSSTGSGGGSGGGGNACRYGGQIVPCYLPGVGVLDSSDGCYYSVAQPQPPAGDPAWQGHPVTDGAVYIRTCPLQGGNGVAAVWRAAPPDPGPKVTPGELAHLAVAKLKLQPSQPATAPDAAHSAVVGADVWLWLRQTPDSYADRDHPLTVTAAVPGLSVTAQVWTSGVDWQMGDGAVVHCAGAGTPYSADQAARPSPDCGYRYTRPSAGVPGQQYQIDATVAWHVHWTSSDGAAGDFDMDPVLGQATGLTVEELQVLNH